MHAIPFFVDTIAIRPHSATEARHVGRRVTVREFAGEEPVSLWQDGHDLHLEAGTPGTAGYRFVTGPEAD